jgi:hypothetical protein
MRLGTFLITTILFFFLAHYLAVLPHEYAHSIMAWLLGVKSHPMNIHYGFDSFRSIVLLTNIDENNNYFLMYLLGKRHLMPLISFAGPGIGNGSMYLISLYCLNRVRYLQKKPLLYYFIFWFHVMCLGNLYDYVPIRVFSTHGDIGHILFGLNNLSPWWVFIPITYLVLFLIFYFFTNTLLKIYKRVIADSAGQQAILMSLMVITIFYFFASPGLSGYGQICRFISIVSIASIPAILYMNWPSRAWVKRRLNTPCRNS